jgi:hypothetical protein
MRSDVVFFSMLLLTSCGKGLGKDTTPELGLDCASYPFPGAGAVDTSTLYRCFGWLEYPGCDGMSRTRQAMDNLTWARVEPQATECYSAYMRSLAASTAFPSLTTSGVTGCEDTGIHGQPDQQPSAAPEGSNACFSEPGEDACVTCAKAACCDAYVACMPEDVCSCWPDCVRAHPTDFNACVTQCGEPTQATWDAYGCLSGACAAQCTGCQ